MPDFLSRFRPILRGMALVVVLNLAACATLEDRAEKSILDALPRVLGPAASYVATVTGATRQRGSIVEMDRVHAVGKRVQRPGAPVLDYVETEMTGVRIDRAARTLIGLTGADAKVSVLAADVAEFLQRRAMLEDINVSFAGSDVVLITARPVIAGYSLPRSANIHLRGYFVPQGSQLRLNITDLRVGGFPVGTIPTYVLERLINPLVDLSALPVATQVVQARVEGNILIITAKGSQIESVSK